MAGNVWEWCSTAYGEYPYDTGDGREALATDVSRIVRGGAWGYPPRAVRCADRFAIPTTAPVAGFRVVLGS